MSRFDFVALFTSSASKASSPLPEPPHASRAALSHVGPLASWPPKCRTAYKLYQTTSAMVVSYRFQKSEDRTHKKNVRSTDDEERAVVCSRCGLRSCLAGPPLLRCRAAVDGRGDRRGDGRGDGRGRRCTLGTSVGLVRMLARRAPPRRPPPRRPGRTRPPYSRAYRVAYNQLPATAPPLSRAMPLAPPYAPPPHAT